LSNLELDLLGGGAAQSRLFLEAELPGAKTKKIIDYEKTA